MDNRMGVCNHYWHYSVTRDSSLKFTRNLKKNNNKNNNNNNNNNGIVPWSRFPLSLLTPYFPMNARRESAEYLQSAERRIDVKSSN